MSVGAGLLGSLTGLGGGIVIIPVLTLILKIDIHYAIGVSLISVIATSSGSAVAKMKDGFTNIRTGMFLEVAAIAGAILGTVIAVYIAPKWIAVIFGLTLLYSSYMTYSNSKLPSAIDKSDPLATFLRLNGEYRSEDGLCKYYLQSVISGFLIMLLAGIFSGLLGIGSGALKVIGMDRMMRMPFKVSTATSNFMIGITAAASAGIYLNRGYIDPGLAMPVMLGVLSGAIIGTRFLKGMKTRTLRIIFSITIAFLGAEMLYNSFTGRF